VADSGDDGSTLRGRIDSAMGGTAVRFADSRYLAASWTAKNTPPT
jgi:hypothetical protein